MASRICDHAQFAIGKVTAMDCVKSLESVGRRNNWLIALLCVSVCLESTQAASDIQIAFPSGWVISTYSRTPYAFGGDSVAFVLRQNSSAAGATRVLQVRNIGASQTLVTTDIPGDISSIEFSPDGSRLLVNHNSPSFGAGGHRASVLDATGAVTWYRDQGGPSRFSTSGQSLSVTAGADERSFGREINVFDVSGSFVRRVVTRTDVPTRKDFLFSSILVGNGDKAIVYTIGGLTSVLLTTDPPAMLWRLTNSRPDLIEREQVYPLDESTLVQTQPTGFRIVRIEDGAVLHAWDPIALSSANPDTSPSYWSGFRVSAGSAPGTALLFDSSSVVFVLDIATGSLNKGMVNASVPAGFAIQPDLYRQKAVFLSPTGARIRNLIVTPVP